MVEGPESVVVAVLAGQDTSLTQCDQGSVEEKIAELAYDDAGLGI